MSGPFIGEIRMFGGNFAPREWAFCDGQLLAINQYDALFSLLGTTYGGDGRSTFGLPDLRGRVPIHQGQGPGLSNRRIGSKAGAETAQLPVHTHPMGASSQAGTSASPAAAVPAAVGLTARYHVGPAFDEMNAAAVSLDGGGQSHTNVQPFQCVNFIIALAGVYPSRS